MVSPRKIESGRYPKKEVSLM